MSINDARYRCNLLKDKLLELKKIASLIKYEMFSKDENGFSLFNGGEDMSVVYPSDSVKMQECWEEIQRNIPPGFDIDGHLIRHLSFNKAHDWADIASHDIPRELLKMKEYEKKIILVEYVETLHSEVCKVSEIILNGDIDTALKAVFASFDARVRYELKLNTATSTGPAIGKAFNDGVLCAPSPENNDSARNFLQGVLGYFRSNIVHKPLPSNRNDIYSSLSLFCVAHEAFRLFDLCISK